MQFIKYYRKAQQPTIVGLAVLLVMGLLTAMDVLADPDVGVKTALPPRKDSLENTKGSFVCRACVELSEIFLNDSLPSIRERYTRYIGKPPSSAASTGENIGGAYSAAQVRGARQRMAVELHDGIDGLCDRLREKHSSLQVKTPEGVQAGLGGGLEVFRRGIRSVCEDTLEEISDAFLTAALQVLLPGASSGGAEPQAHELPRASAFCEAQQLCHPYHYTMWERMENVNPTGGHVGGNLPLDDDILPGSVALWRRLRDFLRDLWNGQQALGGILRKGIDVFNDWFSRQRRSLFGDDNQFHMNSL
ncbi:unnamed protein product [Phytomonas sp. EM1]|nr:unnamed protein product [Phytomonas sp. EM1]|eukprot:CCW65791.1 unnamed protein product [Phytomonas sp. isolate EM1]